MKTATKKKSPYLTKDGFAYLTKRTVVTQARVAGRLAASKAMTIMGYVVTTADGWVVKKYADGKIEKLSKI